MRTGWVLGLVLTAAVATAAEPVYTPHQTRYDVQWKFISFVDAEVVITPTDRKNCFRGESIAYPNAFIRMFYGEPYEASEFCIRNGVIRSQHYEFSLRPKSDDNFTMAFDWARRKVKTLLADGTETDRDLPRNTHDRFVVREVVRQWVKKNDAQLKEGDELRFSMMDNDSVDHYVFEFMGRETVETPVGTFETLRVDRVSIPERILQSWFAPSRDYTIVELKQVRNGTVDLRLLIAEP